MQLKKKIKEQDDWKVSGIFFLFWKEFVWIYIYIFFKPQFNETSKLKFIFQALPLLFVFL